MTDLLHPSITLYENSTGLMVGATLRSASPLSCDPSTLLRVAASNHISSDHLLAAGATKSEIESLTNSRLLVSPEEYDEMMRDRRVAYWSLLGIDPREAASRLRSATVCIVGLGGVGSVVAACLARQGIGSLILIDSDHVEHANLAKSIIYDPKDVGKTKARILSRELAPFSNITIFENFIETLENIPIVDFLVWAGDESERDTFHRLTELAQSGRFGLTTGGISEHEIIVGPTLFSGDTAPDRNKIVRSIPIYRQPHVNSGVVSSVTMCGTLLSDQVCFAMTGTYVATRNTVITYDPILLTSRSQPL